MRTGVFRLIRQEPREAMRHIGPAAKHLLTDGENAARTAMQFMLKGKKEDGE
jgi:hypothetical protein